MCLIEFSDDARHLHQIRCFGGRCPNKKRGIVAISGAHTHKTETTTFQEHSIARYVDRLVNNSNDPHHSGAFANRPQLGRPSFLSSGPLE